MYIKYIAGSQSREPFWMVGHGHTYYICITATCSSLIDTIDGVFIAMEPLAY